MKIAGIIAEYNPFHRGHACHIAQTRVQGATHIAAVMSGNFVQRAEPAIAQKHLRTRAALAGGVDLVLEQPLPWALSGAQGFARGAAALLDALGCVDVLSFGSESGDLAGICLASELLDSPKLPELLRPLLESGLPFAKARETAIAQLAGRGAADLLCSPNDTLAVEYVNALRRIGSKIEPLAIARKGAQHDSAQGEAGFYSASQIREIMRVGGDWTALLPPECIPIYQNANCPSQPQKLETAILARMRSVTAQELAAAPDISEGIENRLLAAARQAITLEELLQLAKTKRYSHARLRRIVWSVFLGLCNTYKNEAPPYLRVLGMTPRGREILRSARKTAALPIVMKIADVSVLDDKAQQIFALECRAADLFGLCLPQVLPCGGEYTENVVILEENA